jgi:hypothetical protein
VNPIDFYPSDAWVSGVTSNVQSKEHWKSSWDGGTVSQENNRPSHGSQRLDSKETDVRDLGTTYPSLLSLFKRENKERVTGT